MKLLWKPWRSFSSATRAIAAAICFSVIAVIVAIAEKCKFRVFSLLFIKAFTDSLVAFHLPPSSASILRRVSTLQRVFFTSVSREISFLVLCFFSSPCSLLSSPFSPFSSSVFSGFFPLPSASSGFFYVFFNPYFYFSLYAAYFYLYTAFFLYI